MKILKAAFIRYRSIVLETSLRLSFTVLPIICAIVAVVMMDKNISPLLIIFGGCYALFAKKLIYRRFLMWDMEQLKLAEENADREIVQEIINSIKSGEDTRASIINGLNEAGLPQDYINHIIFLVDNELN